MKTIVTDKIELARERARQYYYEHRKEVLENVKEYNATRKKQKSEYDKKRRIEKKEELKEKKRLYYQNNKGKILNHNKQYRKTIPEKMLEYCRKWKHEHKEKVNENTRNRRARIRGNGGVLTVYEWQAILKRYGNKCLKCGSTDRIEADHVIPISLGGINDFFNIQPLCRICNASKGNKIEDYR